MWGVGEWTDIIEALACGRHVGWNDGDSFCGAVWILYSWALALSRQGGREMAMEVLDVG